MKQVIVSKTEAAANLRIADVPQAAVTHPAQALIRVESISLNRGEVSRAFFRAENGWMPGWDFAGTIVQAGKDGPPAGTRVAGFKEEGSWAEHIVAEPGEYAPIPDGISVEEASTLPLAGLTALYALDKGGNLAGKRVLITGATGGVGQFAVQLALAAGATVTAAVYRNAIAPPHGISADRFRQVKMDDGGLRELRAQRFDLVLESVGGDVFGAAVESLAPGGVVVVLGATRDVNAQFNIRQFFSIGHAQMVGFSVFDEAKIHTVGQGLQRLFQFVLDGRLAIPVTYRGSVEEIELVARKLLDSQIPGKAVLSWS